jgi:hypothetical protein
MEAGWNLPGMAEGDPGWGKQLAGGQQPGEGKGRAAGSHHQSCPMAKGPPGR